MYGRAYLTIFLDDDILSDTRWSATLNNSETWMPVVWWGTIRAAGLYRNTPSTSTRTCRYRWTLQDHNNTDFKTGFWKFNTQIINYNFSEALDISLLPRILVLKSPFMKKPLKCHHIKLQRKREDVSGRRYTKGRWRTRRRCYSVQGEDEFSTIRSTFQYQNKVDKIWQYTSLNSLILCRTASVLGELSIFTFFSRDSCQFWENHWCCQGAFQAF